MRRVTILLILTVLLLPYCGDVELNSGNIEIRIQNSSNYTYTDILVNTSGGENMYGDINPGERSSYMNFDFAYRYAFIELKINGATFTLQPIDYVGETRLPEGRYTYEVDAADQGGQYDRLSLTFIED